MIYFFFLFAQPIKWSFAVHSLWLCNNNLNTFNAMYLTWLSLMISLVLIKYFVINHFCGPLRALCFFGRIIFTDFF